MNLKKTLLPLAILALALAGFAALKATRPVKPAVQPQERVWQVETLAIQPARLSPVLTLTGRLESPELTQAAAPAMGRVSMVKVREGDAVRAGQTLLSLDPRDFLPRVEQARGQVSELAAQLQSEQLRHAADVDQLREEQRLLGFAQEDLARFERLQGAQFYSPAAVDQSRSNLVRQQLSVRNRELAIADHQARSAQLNARLDQARASLAQAELALERSRVVAPFDGVVAKLQVAVGDQVNTGQILLSLYPSAGIEARAKIPAPYQDEILSRLAADQALQAFSTLAGQPLKWRLGRASGTADSRGLDGFFRLAPAIQPAAAALRVGSLITLQMTRPAIEAAVAIPYEALYGGDRVYRVNAGRLQAVMVRVLGEAQVELASEDRPGQPSPPARLLIESPELKAGDRLLATHLPNAVTGLRVEAGLRVETRQ